MNTSAAAVSDATPALGREPGDDTSTELPTEAEMEIIRKKWKALGDDLADQNKGNLRASNKLPSHIKLRVFLLHITKAADPSQVTKAAWDDFFARVDSAIQLETGWKGLAKLINKVNGIETK
jgi:hypothetical protein